jgi:REP element-mobilizing transposase RayT
MKGFTAGMTTWHITFGTYGTRLHGGDRMTVRRGRDEPGTEIIGRDPDLEEMNRNPMRGAPVHLTREQCLFVQEMIPSLCERGGWTLRICSADHDHVHVLVDIEPAVHGEKVRRLIKRWLTQAMDTKWPRPQGGRWWAEQGSNKVVGDAEYLTNAHEYIEKQRTR